MPQDPTTLRPADVLPLADAVSHEDDLHMRQALQLARTSTGLAHPNPMVGAVLVKNGRVIGEGSHIYDKRDHAEVVALRQAGAEARGATMYVSLEPCCTTGRTGPCTKALIDAGVTRVVAAMADPNPDVAGRGFAQLRKAGIQITAGIREKEAQRINEDFASWITAKHPLVTLKSALTLDGKIAAKPGASTTITGEASLAKVQHLRHAADALLTGIGTILVDDPLLTDRTGLPRRRKLLRVILDSRLRLPLASKIVQSAADDLLVIATSAAPASRARKLRHAGVEVIDLPAKSGRVDLGEVMKELTRREMLNAMLETGAELNGSALRVGIVDKIFLFYAPRIMGAGGLPFTRIASRNFAKLPPLANITLHKFGEDFAVEGYFHDVYGYHRARRKN